MKLIFIRHGQATAYCADDAGRNLTEFGQAQALETATHLLKHHQLDMIITSPFNRANQTAKILEKLADTQGQHPTFITLDSITPDDDPTQGLSDIEQIIAKHYGLEHNKTIAIVCHMPIVARMVSLMHDFPATTFELAECRVLESQVFAKGLANQTDNFIPKQPQ